MKLRITYQEDGLVFPVRIQPRASRNQVAGVYDGALKIRLTAPPLENRANQQLVQFLAEILGLPPARLRLASGARSRNKTVAVQGLSREQLAAALAQYLV